MGEAILFGACLTGLQGLRSPLDWEPAEAADTNNVVSKATGVDIAHREPGSRLPWSRLRRQFDDTTLAHRELAPTEPEKTTVRRHFYHVLSLTIQLYQADCLISVYSHVYCIYRRQLGAQLLIYGEAGLQAVSQSAVTRCTSSQQGDCARGPHAIIILTDDS